MDRRQHSRWPGRAAAESTRRFRLARSITPALPDSALDVVFPFEGLTVRYVPGMTPITAASGTATLKGDSFRAQVVSGSIGPLALSAGDVAIPELHVSGTTAHIVAHADGTTADILRLIDEPPLGYPKRFGIAAATVEGRSTVDLQFDLPLLKDLLWDQVRFLVTANATQLGLPIAQRKLEWRFDPIRRHTIGAHGERQRAICGRPGRFSVDGGLRSIREINPPRCIGQSR